MFLILFLCLLPCFARFASHFVYSVFLYFFTPFVYSCLFPIFAQVYRPLPPVGNQIAVNIYYINKQWVMHTSLQHTDYLSVCLSLTADFKRITASKVSRPLGPPHFFLWEVLKDSAYSDHPHTPEK